MINSLDGIHMSCYVLEETKKRKNKNKNILKKGKR